MFRTSARILSAAGILVVVASATTWGLTVSDIVGQVSQANYTDILYNQLYTHLGSNRSVKGGAQHDLAAQNIYLSLRRDGLTTRYDPFTYTTGGTTYNCRNVVAVKQGTLHPDQIFMMGCHYDSTGYAGADDNASGAASVMEAARVLSQYDFDSTIIFCAFDCEEWGEWGSKHVANDYAGSNILGMVDSDMIAYNQPNKLNQAIVYGANSAIKTAVRSAVSLYSNGITTTDGGEWTSSDHYPFETKGFAACWLYEAEKLGNPNWHTVNDNVDNPGYIDYTYATNMTRAFTGYLATAAGFTGSMSASVPEPGSMLTMLTLAMGLCCLIGAARRRRLL